MMLLLMMLTATTAWADSAFSGGDGSQGDPYQIKTIADLGQLATDVNGGNDYNGKYFRLMNDIDFNDDTTLKPTKTWNDATSQENNYTAIGLYSGTTANRRYFCGHFDGNGMTIRGIRIYSTETSKGFGLFGLIGSGAEVKNVVLDDARIAGGGYSAGIVGWNEGGTIDGCQATAKVAVVGTRPDAITQFLGGIVGRNGINGSSAPDGSTVKNCTSSVTISNIGSEKSRYCGGIAGFNKGTMTDNFVIGANICKAQSDDHGAIIGHSNSTGTTVQRNYYRDCTVAGVANAIDKGCENSNITADDGAMPVFTLTMGTGITTTTDATVTYSGTPYYVFGKAITLSGGLDNVGSFAPGYTAGYATTSGSVSGNATDGFILTMGYGDATVSASNRYPIDWAMESTGNDADHAYMIYNPEQLDLLAQRVNNGEGYAGKFFKLGANIAYAHKAANEEGVDTENNYTAIGNYISSSHPFNGTFLGQNHVVSGIRIYKSGSNSAASRQGLFGYVGKTGVVSNVIVTDARIVGYGQLGVIAGSVFYNSSLSHNYYFNCTVGTATTSIGCNGADITDNDGAVSIHTLTLADGITAEPTPVFTISGTPYYSVGTTVTLSYNGTSPTGCIHEGYIVTKDGTDPAETVEVAESNGVYSFTMPASNVTVSAVFEAIPWSGTGTSTDPYIIEYPSQLDLLAHRVNGTHGETANNYYQKFFRLGADITYAHTTAWNDASSTENNYTAIGERPNFSTEHPFSGTFDGDGHTVSGIRIYKGGSGWGNYFQGLFGFLAGATVKNVTVADARITGDINVGGIAGDANDNMDIQTDINSTIENCHVLSDVTIHAVVSTDSHGGIAGNNRGTVSNCTSAATLTVKDGVTGCTAFGGIVGYQLGGVISNNLAVGVTMPAGTSAGAICGCKQGGTFEYNYYSNCAVGTATSNIGCYGADIETDPNDATNHPDGAVFAPATRYGAITMIEKGTKKHAIIDGNYSGTDGINIAEDFAVDDVTFNRTFPADKYCTIVLPFEINTSYLTGVDYVLSFAGMTYDENGMLTYMAQIVWEKSLEHVDLQSYTPYMVLTNRSRLSINNTTPVTIERTRDAFTEKDDWEFRGVTAYTIWDATHNNALLGRVYGFAATSGKATDGVTDVNVGDFVRAEAGAYAYPLRAYLLKKETSSAAPRRAVALDDLPDRIPVRIVDSATGSTTSVNEELRMKSEEFLSGESVARNAAATGWFTLSGTRLNKQPTAKGLYIHNGLKVVIK